MGFSVVVVFISGNMPLFKVWSEDKLNKKFVVAENFAELVSKGKREPFKKPIKCGFSKKNIFIEIKNLLKIALRDFGYLVVFLSSRSLYYH